MSKLTDFLGSVAPTVASALLGPMGGVAIAGVGKLLGIDGATTEKITKALQDGQLTPEQMTELKKLEMEFRQHESEMGFKYADLEFRDRDSARNMAIQTHSITPSLLTWLIVAIVLMLEGYVMLKGVPEAVADLVAGRILGTLDAALTMVLAFWFGSNSQSNRKTELLAMAQLPTEKK